MTKVREMLRIDPRYYDGKQLSQEEILHWFNLCDAVWLHDGDLQKPHAALTSRLCSNGFFDCQRVLEYPNINEILARQLASKLKGSSGVWQIDWVIGSSYAAITFSYEVAKALGVNHGFVEKDPTDPDKKRMLWQRSQIPAGAKVIQTEELITTAGTIVEVRRAVEEGNSEPVNFLPIVGALVHRPPKLRTIYGDRKVIALIEKEIWAVKPEDCPLCRAGSPRYRPKTHWRELTGGSN